MTKLSGITWNHTRGYLPMVATAQRFCELNPDIHIRWEVRSLQEFADASLADLTARFDLLVIDHPSIGEAAEQDLLLPLNELLPETVLRDQQKNSVGGSFASYDWNGKQYALAIDAATPIAGWRPDLLAHAGVEVPKVWEDVLALAHRGLVAVPAIPIDSLMNFFMLVLALGAEPFRQPGEVAPQAEGKHALELLRELVTLSAPGSLDRNPIRTWQLLTDSDTVAYCPFAYGYSNYSRAGYAQNVLKTGGLVSLEGTPLRSTLGGAGLAISRRCAHPEIAVAYASYTGSASVQSTVYTHAGGQPGHRAAWHDSSLNAATNNFFLDTMQTLDQAWMRPRFPGYIHFQDAASNLVHHYLVNGGSPTTVLAAMNQQLKKMRTAA